MPGRVPAETARHRLLADCRRVLRPAPSDHHRWLLAGSFGKREDVWQGATPVSDLDLVALTTHRLEALPPAVLDIEARYRMVNPTFRIDVKQIAVDRLPELAGTIFGYDLAHAPALHAESGRLRLETVAPTGAAACFLIANRYVTWLDQAVPSALDGTGPMWFTLQLQLSTCNIVLAAATAHVILKGRYEPGLTGRFAAARELFAARPGWIAAVEEAARVRAAGVCDAEPPRGLWLRWARVVVEMLCELDPGAAGGSVVSGPVDLVTRVAGWPAEAGTSSVQSVPASPVRTPPAAKSTLQTAAIVLAHCHADTMLRNELDRVSRPALPGWLGTWEASRIALIDAWQRIRKGVRQ
jgi:hypothetical protein